MYRAQGIFQHHNQCKKCALYLIKYGNILNNMGVMQVMAKYWFYHYDHYVSMSHDLSTMKQGKNWEKCNKNLLYHEWATLKKIKLPLWAENKLKNHF